MKNLKISSAKWRPFPPGEDELINMDLNILFTGKVIQALVQYKGHLSRYRDSHFKENTVIRPGPVFCLLLGVSSNYAQPITGQVT